VGEERVADDVAESDGTDAPRPEMLVAIGPRGSFRSRVVQVDERDAVGPDPRIELAKEAIDSRRVRHVDTGAPGMRGVEAEGDIPGADAPVREAIGDRRQFVDGGAEAAASARRVLEDEAGAAGGRTGPISGATAGRVSRVLLDPIVHGGQRGLDAADESPDPDVDTAAAV
jgi:hypothetical protein